VLVGFFSSLLLSSFAFSILGVCECMCFSASRVSLGKCIDNLCPACVCVCVCVLSLIFSFGAAIMYVVCN